MYICWFGTNYNQMKSTTIIMVVQMKMMLMEGVSEGGVEVKRLILAELVALYHVPMCTNVPSTMCTMCTMCTIYHVYHCVELVAAGRTLWPCGRRLILLVLVIIIFIIISIFMIIIIFIIIIID